MPVLLFEKMTGDKVDKFECAAIIAKEAFEKLFHSWLVWNVTDPNTCSILQAILEDQGTYARSLRSKREYYDPEQIPFCFVSV